MKKFNYGAILFVLIVSCYSKSFGQVGIGTSSPDSSAALDIRATTNDKGLLIPRLTQTQRDAISAPSSSLLIFQTDNNPGFYYYDGSSWTNVSGVKNVNGNSPTADGNINIAFSATQTGDQANRASTASPTDGLIHIVQGDTVASENGKVYIYSTGISTWTLTTAFANTDDQNISGSSFNTTTNILTINIEDGASENINLSSLAVTHTLDQVTDVGSTTVNGISVGSLTINSAYTLPTIAGASGQYLTVSSTANQLVFSSSSTPTLDQVTDVNSSTTNSISIGGLYTSIVSATTINADTVSSSGYTDNSLGAQNELLIVGASKRITSTSALTLDSGNLIVTGSVSASTGVSAAGTVTATGNLIVQGNSRFGGDITTTDSDLTFEDLNGSYPTSGKGFFWKLNTDQAKIYAVQPGSDKINFYFSLADNAEDPDDDQYIFWHKSYLAGTSNDRFPLVMNPSGFYVYASPSSTESVPDLSSWAMKIEPDGDVDISKNIVIDGTGTVGGTSITSDRRLKSNIQNNRYGLESVLQLKSKVYDKYISPEKEEKLGEEIGFIAQDILKLIPTLVKEGKDGLLNVNYNGLIPVLTKAIQEQQDQINLLLERIDVLENAIKKQ